MDLSKVTKGTIYKPYWQTMLPAAGINTRLRLAAYFAQCDHESAGFTAVVEKLNYSATALMATFPRHFNDAQLAQRYARNPQMIANRVYANRMGNGDEASGDGWKYRGRGIIQLTGKNNYTAYNPSTLANPDIVAQPEHAVRSSIWFWTTNNLNRLADAQNFIGLTRRINGGTNGLAHRQQLYEQYLNLF